MFINGRETVNKASIQDAGKSNFKSIKQFEAFLSSSSSFVGRLFHLLLLLLRVKTNKKSEEKCRCHCRLFPVKWVSNCLMLNAVLWSVTRTQHKSALFCDDPKKSKDNNKGNSKIDIKFRLIYLKWEKRFDATAEMRLSHCIWSDETTTRQNQLNVDSLI